MARRRWQEVGFSVNRTDPNDPQTFVLEPQDYQLTLLTPIREVSFGCVPARGVRVERRAAGTTGRKSFVSVHTRPTVTRDPLPELYRDVGDA